MGRWDAGYEVDDLKKTLVADKPLQSTDSVRSEECWVTGRRYSLSARRKSQKITKDGLPDGTR